MYFSRNLAVLNVPDQEISINMGLNQGDHLTHFLFLLLAKDLSGLFSKVDELNLFMTLKWAPQSFGLTSLVSK